MRMRSAVAAVLAVGLLGTVAARAQKAGDNRIRARISPSLPKPGWSPAADQVKGAQPPPPVDVATPQPIQAENDPVQVVENFVQRNVKEADESIKALTEEAEALRARLAKVEEALGKWQAVTQALQPANQPPILEIRGAVSGPIPVNPPPIQATVESSLPPSEPAILPSTAPPIAPASGDPPSLPPAGERPSLPTPGPATTPVPAAPH